MDFFAEQAKFRRRSQRSCLVFLFAVIGVVVVVDVLVAAIYHGWHLMLFSTAVALSPHAFGKLSAVLVAGIALAAIYRTRQLRWGGSVVAEGLGARRVAPDTTTPAQRRLCNVVEEIAIASSVPVPDIFVLENEPGINAFSAGQTPSNAAICITQGCLDNLTRDELQGIVAHEFSHVLNGDIRLNIRMVGLLYGILCINLWGHALANSAVPAQAIKGDNENSQAGRAVLLMMGLIAISFGALGSLFARLAQAAVARSRESLADAAAVQFTRNTQGILGVLLKIAAIPVGSTLFAPRRQEIAHMVFCDALRSRGLFATHPSLRRRLEALGARWNRHEIERLTQAWRDAPPHSRRNAVFNSAPGHTPAQLATLIAAQVASGSSAPTSISDRVGRPSRENFADAGQLRGQIAPELRMAAYHPQRADAVLLALAINHAPEVQEAQLAIIRSAIGNATEAAVKRLLPLVTRVDPTQRLPLVALAFPALRQRPRKQLLELLDTLMKLVRCDQRIDLHEYCLLRMVAMQMRDFLDPASGTRSGTLNLHACRDSLASLYAIVAAHGQPGNERAAQAAFQLAVQRTKADWRASYRPPEDWQPTIDAALAHVGKLRPTDKQRVIDGLAAAVSADGIMNIEESELLRVICGTLRCPLPVLHVHPAVAAG